MGQVGSKVEFINSDMTIQSEMFAGTPISDTSVDQEGHDGCLQLQPSFAGGASGEEPGVLVRRVETGCSDFRTSELQMLKDEEATITLAPPEKWLEPKNSDDEEVEDGELCDSDEEISSSENFSISQLHQKIAFTNHSNTGRQNGKTLKGGTLDAGVQRSCSDDEVSPASSSGQGSISVSDYDTQSCIMDQEPQNHGRAARMEEESLLLPLFREVIDSERKKKAELEDENTRLKSMLAKVSLEKEETFQMLQTSNKALRDATDEAACLEAKVNELTAQVATKNATIKDLSKNTSEIKDVLSRMTKTFDGLKQKDVSKRPAAEELQLPDEKKNAKKLRVDPPVSDKNESKHSTKINVSCPEKVSMTKPVTNNEAFIMEKLKDLKRWRYNLKDIKKKDGMWRCPECGEQKFTLLATAAHARDKHVWKCLGPASVRTVRRLR